MTTTDKQAREALMSEIDLKPCPFCGSGGAELMLFCDPEEGRDNSGPSRRIQCAVCHIEAPFYPTEKEAITAWNTRAPLLDRDRVKEIIVKSKEPRP